MGRFFSVVVAVLASGFVPAVVLASSSCQVTQLTNGEPISDLYPQVSGSSVIWQRHSSTGT